MNQKKTKHHTVDFLFVITLFFLFAFSSMALIAVGAQVYEKSVTNMNENSSRRTISFYITEKIRQCDHLNAVSTETVGDFDALTLTETISDETYVTYLYVYDGWLKELLVKSGTQLSPESGQNIMEISDFSIETVSDSLFCIHVTDANGSDLSFYINTHCSNERMGTSL